MSELSGVGKHLSLRIRRGHPLQGSQAFAIGIAHGGKCRSPVAQLVEQAAVNRWVAGSSPARGASTRAEAGQLAGPLSILFEGRSRCCQAFDVGGRHDWGAILPGCSLPTSLTGDSPPPQPSTRNGASGTCDRRRAVPSLARSQPRSGNQIVVESRGDEGNAVCLPLSRRSKAVPTSPTQPAKGGQR